ncbi:hypothetical protein GCM10010329_86780 [Streptomyces spiroverticillatus]|nr:hypothetical protein GCM10010329_86780 [Streptomyces spiroverticillatus]
MKGCPCCCTVCDHGYIRDVVFDPDTRRNVPQDSLCDCNRVQARLCKRCESRPSAADHRD